MYSNRLCTNLGGEHEALPYHQRREDDHRKIQQLERKLSLVRPELLKLQDLFVDHILDHVTFILMPGCVYC